MVVKLWEVEQKLEKAGLFERVEQEIVRLNKEFRGVHLHEHLTDSCSKEEIKPVSLEKAVNFIDKVYHKKDQQHHCQKAHEYVTKLCRLLDFAPREQRYAEYVANVHDVGIICLPDEITAEPQRKLSRKEYALAKLHVDAGFYIAANVDCLKLLAPLILTHHERYDGRGYPQGLKKDKIPKIARVIALAEAYADMSLRQGLSDAEIIPRIKKSRGKAFEPEYADRFVSLLRAEIMERRNRAYLSHVQ